MKLKYLLTTLLVTAACSVFAQVAPVDYRVENSKSSLSKISAGNPSSNSISDIVTVGDTVWISSSKGLSRSTDKGETWKNYYGTDPFGFESTSAIAYDYSTGIIWVATAHSEDKSGNSVDVGTGLHYSTDKGATWKSVPQPVDSEGDSLMVYGLNDGVTAPKVRVLPVTVTPQNVTWDIAFTKNTVWITSFAGGLRKSTDKGATWQRVILPCDSVNNVSPNRIINYSLQPVAGNFGKENYLNHRVFSVVSANDSTLYVGTAGGINRSDDNGISWTKFSHTNQDSPISGNFVVALGYNKLDSTIWGATWKAEGSTEFYAVSYSTDKGATWKTALENEKTHNFGFKYYDVIAATDNGAFRTQNAGLNWITPNSIIDSKTNLAITSNFFYSAASSGSNVWLGSGDGLARLTENYIWSGSWKVFFASQALSSNTSTHAYPNPFSPKLDLLKIKYSTNNKTANVTIRVFDFGMNLVKTVIQNAERGSAFHTVDAETNSVVDFWNGKDENGKTVPNGVYFYRVDVGSDDPMFGKILVLQ